MDTLQAKYQRRPKMVLTAYGTNIFYIKHPWVTALWSAMFPGFGHLMLCQYLKFIALCFWELFINRQANLNTAILYIFTGRFAEAKSCLNIDWLLLYAPVYVFAIWDSYRATVDLNKGNSGMVLELN